MKLKQSWRVLSPFNTLSSIVLYAMQRHAGHMTLFSTSFGFDSIPPMAPKPSLF